MKKLIWMPGLVLFCFSAQAQNVGIGTETPTQKLEVAGNAKAFNVYATGYVGINTTSPAYRLHIYDGSMAISNTTDNVTYSMAYSAAGNYFYTAYNGVVRMSITTAGNVGIGLTQPVYKLDVNGTFHAASSIYTDGNAYIDGNLTVNGGKGIMRNATGSAQLKYYTRTVSFSTGTLAGNALSAEASIGFVGGIFATPPQVFVGDIVSTGGTQGQLYRVLLILYDVTTTGCKARLLNTSPNTVNYDITWNIVCMGD